MEIERLVSKRRCASPSERCPRIKTLTSAPPAIPAEARPTAPDDPLRFLAQQLDAAGNGDRAALSPTPLRQPLANAARIKTLNVAPPAIPAEAAPTAPDDPTALLAQQLGAAGNGDRAALSPNAAAPALRVAPGSKR